MENVKEGYLMICVMFPSILKQIDGEFGNRLGTERFLRSCLFTYRTGAGRRLYVCPDDV